ncbi:pyrophosphate-dependent phosphofructose kinase [Plasmopara halstedii]|uniref:Pyrophosphate-dependent phosphofructose kinase n=1 Tax=Plasmopara halstedii TaxID=4781 RepID=A0A0P1AST1_PLAHL|nr:pyrophosphate-dependent phosphofructose kinase [Plasmopara halstedii]CEG45133.1 pyrophosphate-dependent phosphofructose kinase [Plasmopara halstedii]|eukprot:XP_024581502.1 pyrophosphate-dependent phosphofructose kinase [Plasmopara halstedii]
MNSSRHGSVDSSTADFQAAHKSAPFASKHPKGFGEMVLIDGISIEKTYLLPVPNLREWLPDKDSQLCNRRKLDTQSEGSVERKSTYNKIMGESDVILGDIRRNDSQQAVSRAYVRAGPRENTYFDPSKVKAAVVTCGGLCPGLNNVVRDVTLALWNLYGVREIYGIRMGFAGFSNWTSMDQKEAPIMLTPKSVASIHHYGGTILGSNRGGFDQDKIINFLTTHGVSQLYVIGGDGTHRAANKISDECRRRKLAVAVAGVPKTIDNDVDLLDRSFGFNTAVEEAQRAIRSASTEARCVPNGIGVVKLMGRSAGFIAAHASLSSGDVNLCLIPEIPIELEGPRSCLDHLERVVEDQGHGVVVVAEGAGEELLGTSVEADAGGNKKLPPVGAFMKDRIQEHFAKKGKVCTVKYIDPSYMIRSVPANAADSLYCMLLGQNAVHGAMAGYTGFTVGLSANRVVYFPIEAVTRNSPRCMDPFGRTWERVLCLTRQPNTARAGNITGAKSSD